MSAWKAAAGPPKAGQGSRLRRDRQSRQPGLDRVSAGPAFWLPRAYGFLRARRSADHEASSPADQLSDGDRKRSWWIRVDANDPGCVKTPLLCYDSLVILRGKLMRRFVEQADRGQWTLLPDVQQRLDANPLAMRQRRENVEHPFGTMKARMGATHFLTKTLPKVAAEMALSVLAYNLTRVMKIVGIIKPLIAAIAA